MFFLCYRLAECLGLISCRICGVLKPRTHKALSSHCRMIHKITPAEYHAEFGESVSVQADDEVEASSAADSVLCPMCPGHPADRFNCYNTLQHHMKSSHGLTLTLGSVIKKASFLCFSKLTVKMQKSYLFLLHRSPTN